MKSILTLAIALFALHAAGAAANSAPKAVPTVSKYLAQCSTDESFKKEECWGPLMAVFLIGNFPMTTTAGTGGGLCLPKDDKKTAPLLINWLKGQPQYRDSPIPSGLVYAARALYPCPIQAVPRGNFEAAAEVRAHVLAEAIPVSMANSFDVRDDGPDVLLGWRLAKKKDGTISRVPDMFAVIFNDTGEALPDFGGQPTILANVFSRRLVHDRPPSGTDDKIARTGIPTFFIGSRGQDVWEIARHNGLISIRLVNSEGLGPWEAFQNDQSRYSYYSQHLLDGRTVEQDFRDPKVSRLAGVACSGNKVLVKQALDAGADPNGKGVDGDTPIFWAIDCASVDGIDTLLAAGADPNYKLPGRPYSDGKEHFRTHQYSATFAAMLSGNLPMLRLLLEYGGDPESYLDDDKDKTIMWSSVLYATPREDHDPHAWDAFETLLTAYKNRHFADDTEHTIADQLAMFGHYRRVEELLNLGYDYDLPSLGMAVQNEVKMGNGNDDAQHLIAALKKKGVCFPVKFWTEQGGTLTMNADESLQIQWDKPRPGCLPQAAGPTLLKKDNFAYSGLLSRAGGLTPGQTKSMPPAPAHN